MRALLTLILTSCGPTSDPEPNDAHLVQQDGQEDSQTEVYEHDTSPADCESEFGTLSGQILYDLDQMGRTSAAPNANVVATPSDGDNITIRSDAEGTFTASLPADEYLLMANDTDGCVSDQVSMQLEPCDTISMTLRLTECLDGLTNDGVSE
jgi:hypothetical protein